MINRFSNTKIDHLIYLFFTPWILLSISPLVELPVENNQKAMIFLLFILWIQGGIFFITSSRIGTKLIALEQGRYRCIRRNPFLFHGIIDFAIYSVACFILIFSILTPIPDILALPFTLMLTISEIFRAATFSKLLVSLENKREMGLRMYFSTLYLAINPIFGIWNIHWRFLNLAEDKKHPQHDLFQLNNLKSI